jgi:hypothetical protein
VTWWDAAWPAIIFLTKSISFLMKEFEQMKQRVSSLAMKYERSADHASVMTPWSDR